MEMSNIRDQLLSRRREIIEDREEKRASWKDLQQREVEMEEGAAKETLARSIQQLDEQEIEEIKRIDAALGKIETGAYGICESCGQNISEDRLKAIPWTSVCIECAEKQESALPRQPEPVLETPGAGMDGEPTGYTDEEIKEEIKDELVRDGRIETRELGIAVDKGRVYLKGLLPSREKHEILISMIQDVLGYKNVVDRIRIDRQLWEQRKYSEGLQKEESTDKEKMMDSEGGETDVWSSSQDGTSLVPSDKIVPERTGEK